MEFEVFIIIQIFRITTEEQRNFSQYGKHHTITRRKTERKRWWWLETIQFTKEILASRLGSIPNHDSSVWLHLAESYLWASYAIQQLWSTCQMTPFTLGRNETTPPTLHKTVVSFLRFNCNHATFMACCKQFQLLLWGCVIVYNLS